MFLRPLRSFRIGLFQKCAQSTSSQSSDVDFKTSDTKDDELTQFAPNIPEAEEESEKKENFKKMIELKRDVSRFSKITPYNKFKKNLPTYTDSEADYLKTERYFRRIYSRFGKESGIEPGIAWPTKSQLQNLIKEEKEYDLTLEQKIDILVERKTNELKSYEKLVKETDDALKKMPANIEGFYQRIVKKEKSEKDKESKNKELLEKAREYYGYEVNIRDPRIQDMLKKLNDERKATEKAKKKEDEKKKAISNQLQVKAKQEQKNASQTEQKKD